MYHSLNWLVEVIARVLALIGGAMLLGIALLTCISIAGRALLPLEIGLGPIRGIYDMTEIAIAAAVFAFLPWAQLREAHARVELFRKAIPSKVDRALDVLFNASLAFVAFVGTHRMNLGMRDKLSYGETTLIAQIPVWQSYAAGLVGASGFFIVALFCTLRAMRRLAGFEDIQT